MSLQTVIDEDVRRLVLEELAKEPTHSLSELLLLHAVRSAGHRGDRRYLRDQLIWLEDHGRAITLTGIDTNNIAALTQRGLDHVQGIAIIPGVGRKPRA